MSSFVQAEASCACYSEQWVENSMAATVLLGLDNLREEWTIKEKLMDGWINKQYFSTMGSGHLWEMFLKKAIKLSLVDCREPHSARMCL